MSGGMSTALAARASALASAAQLRAEADAAGVHPGVIIGRRLRANLAAQAKAPADSLPGRTWRAIAPEVRVTLVMLAATAEGDPRRLAAQPWESFSDADRASIAATARTFARELAGASCLW